MCKRINANIPIKLAIKIMTHSDNVGMGAVEVTGATKVNKEFAVFVPPGVVTRTLAAPALPAGVVHVAEVLLITLNAEQATPPTVMPVAPVKLVPVIVMGVPPRVEPELGLPAVTVGRSKEI